MDFLSINLNNINISRNNKENIITIDSIIKNKETRK